MDSNTFDDLKLDHWRVFIRLNSSGRPQCRISGARPDNAKLERVERGVAEKKYQSALSVSMPFHMHPTDTLDASSPALTT
jgi:hypothetical protein